MINREELINEFSERLKETRDLLKKVEKAYLELQLSIHGDKDNYYEQ